MSLFLCKYTSAVNSDDKTDTLGRSSSNGSALSIFQSKILALDSKQGGANGSCCFIVNVSIRESKSNNSLCADIIPSCQTAGAVLHSFCFVH